MTRLVDLDPVWVGAGGEGISDKDGNPVPERNGIGITYDCPCGGVCGERPFAAFENPLDGGPKLEGMPAYWIREGDTFETLTLRPSLLRRAACEWHGYLTAGVFKAC